VLGHVGIDAGGDVVADRADLVDLHAVLAHDGRAGVDEPLRVTGFGTLLRVQLT
jgi:hypothetical protein